MDRTPKRFLSVILCLFILHVPAYSGETIRLASGEWPPYQSQKLVNGGFVTHIVTKAFEVGGVDVTLGYFPWKRSFELVKNGKWEGTFIWFDTKERRKDFYISDPVVDIKYVFFHLHSLEFDWKSVEDLKDIKIGATLGYEFGGDTFKDAEEAGIIKVHRVYSDLQGIKNLIQGRIQIFPCDILVGYELIRTSIPPEYRDAVTHHKKPVRAAPHHLLLSKKMEKNQRLMKIFNRELKKIKASGEYNKLFTLFKQGKYRK